MVTQGWLTPANAVTVARIALTPIILMDVVQGKPKQAIIWFAIAAFTDFLDGWLARAQQVSSAVGLYLDPIADKLLLSGVFVALAIAGSIPIWFVILVFGRDFALVVASAIAMRLSTYSDYTPTIWGKLSTALQILAAVIVLAANAYCSETLVSAARGTVLASAAATLWSAIHYTWRGIAYFARKER